MREIKCRALTIKTKRWVEGYYCKVESKHYIFPDDAELCTTTPDSKFMDAIAGMAEVDPETVGRFTGLCDKKRTKEYPKGQEIYEESDGVKYQDSIGVIKWRGYRYHFYNEDGYCGDILKSEDLEVIGNIHIHENPELKTE